MDTKKSNKSQRDRFLKLSLKKNRLNKNEAAKNNDKSSEVIVILDDSFDRLTMGIPNKVQSSPKIYSPIVIDDSSEISTNEASKVLSGKTPSKSGNVSFNRSREENLSVMDTRNTKPGTDGWSPAQNIICATPRDKVVPTTPKDKANESLEHCTMKKIHQSQKKLLNDMYGDVWKSIPSLFKTISNKFENLDSVSKKLRFNDDDESDKENRVTNREQYLTAVKKKKFTCQLDSSNLDSSIEKKSKKKLYTEKVPQTPDLPRQKAVKNPRNAISTVKKKGMTVTELVGIMNNDVDLLTKKVENISVTTPQTDKPTEKAKKIVKTAPKVGKFKENVQIENFGTPDAVRRLSFVGSLADFVPSWRCHPEAIQYIDNFKKLREQLTRRLYAEFNRDVFTDQLDADMIIEWDSRFRSTAGTTTNRLIKTSKGQHYRTSSIKLSTKVVDGPQRLRDTLIHEMCHAATWIIDEQMKDGHGPLWKKWAKRAVQVFPELGQISRCHDMVIHFKYTFKCTRCGYSVPRHSKSIDPTKLICGYCHGTFKVLVNRKTKDGAVVSTPARKAGPNEFSKFVKENYAAVKNDKNSHAEVMKTLGQMFAEKKNKLTSD